MLVVAQLSDIVNEVVVGEVNDMERFLIKRILSKIQFSEYTDVRVVLKGCADEKIPGWVYAFMTAELKKYVKSLMYGEPCSSVPVYKKK